MYPILLNMRGRRVVVVGGGNVAERKVLDLLEAEAQITLISPILSPKLEALIGNIEIRQTIYEPGVLAEIRPLLTFAATLSSEVNMQIAEEARQLGILVNIVDDGGAGDFSNMSVFRQGEIIFAVATGGASPALAAHLRELIESTVGSEYALLAQWIGESRALVKRRVNPKKRRELWRSIIDSPVLQLLRAGKETEARQIFDRMIEEATLQ
jgi:siroheme synthase-like protein